MEELINKIREYKYKEESLFEGKSCFIVGNSESVFKYELGGEIDASDFVMRFNWAKVIGYEKYVGSKTDMRFINIHTVSVINGQHDPLNTEYFSTFPADMFKDLKEKNYLASSDVDLTKVRLMYPAINFTSIDIHTTHFLTSLLGLNPTTGIIGLSYALANFEEVKCVGFDFYEGVNDHYFEKVVKYDRGGCHNITKEKEIMYYLRDNEIIKFYQ